MRTTQRDVTAPRAGRVPDRTPPAAAADRAAAPDLASTAGVLTLQRSAGNAAVSRVLARAIPADPTSLADYKDVQQEIRYDTDVASVDVAANFPGGRGVTRKGVTITERFSGAMAAAGAAPDVESKLRDGLFNIAIGLFLLNEADTDPVIVGATRIHELDLSSRGGQDGRYRFTSILRGGTAAKPTAVDLLIELLGARRAAPKGWSALDAARRQALTDRAGRFNITRDPSYTNDDDWAKVLQGLESIPDNVLHQTRDITFERHPASVSAKGEAGHYHFSTPPPTRTLTLYSSAFGDDGHLLMTLAHELAHGVDFRGGEEKKGTANRSASKAYQDAAKKDGGLKKGVTTYARTDWDEHYAEAYGLYVSEPETLKALRPNTHAYFDGLAASLPAAPAPAPAAATP